jgi:hypothetical protein
MAITTGTNSNNTINGTSAADRIFGLGGNDKLNGLGGNDTLDGGTGNDTLDGGAGNDRLVGGGGNDVYIVGTLVATGTDTLVEIGGTGSGTDTVRSARTYTLGAHIENLVLTGSGNLNGTGNAEANKLTGNGGSNKLFGKDGVDTLDGGAGNDTLDGGTGNDRLMGGTGNDTLVWQSSDSKIDGGTGTDTLLVKGNVAVNLAGVADAKIENVEIIDLAGNGTLTISSDGVLAISDTTHKLRIISGDGDTVIAGSGWIQGGNIEIDERVYEQYSKGGAILQVDVDASVDIGLVGLIRLADLNGTDGIRISGATFDLLGLALSTGDINGDGFDEVIMGTPYADSYAGLSYVMLGGASFGGASAINLSSLFPGIAFRLDGVGTQDFSGGSVGSVDINGDGISDLIIGADRADPVASVASGAAYVVFGATTGLASSLDLSALDGTNGFRIAGEEAQDKAGFSVSAAGDINADGIDDLIIGAPGPLSENGAAYVVFGATSFGSGIDLSALDGTNGFKLLEAGVLDQTGIAVAAAGDVNGDGLDDLIVGAPKADGSSAGSGAAYVVFGSTAPFGSGFALDTLNGTNGFKISGEAGEDAFGTSLSAAGDVNGDGIGDLIIGAYSAPGSVASGASYVVFGSDEGFASNFHVSSLNGTNGFQISGEAPIDRSGISVRGAGDVNGDGHDDLIVGADATGQSNYGSAYLVFGGAGGFPANLQLSSLDGTNGFELLGRGQTGRSVSSGDVNGDGFADLVIGAPFDFMNGNYSGSTFVLYGRDFHGDVDFTGGIGNDPLDGGTGAAEGFIGNRGNDTMTGGGGADVFRGGEGNDFIIVGDAAFADIDGGAGLDTIRLAGGADLNLTGIGDSHLTGIEAFDLVAGSGISVLTLTVRELINLSDTSNTLTIDGDADDTFTSDGTWLQQDNDGDYEVYTSGAARIRIDPDIALDIFIDVS